MPAPQLPAKIALRDQLLTTRRRRSLSEVGEAARALADLVTALAEVRRAARVAAYVSLGTEPGTGLLLEALATRGPAAPSVLLPVLRPDDDLDWALYEGPRALAPAARGLLEPTGPRLGVEAVASADVVLVPALALSSSGMRMGRGGGSYDRALARVPLGTLTCALVYDDELDQPVPVEPHDRAVGAACTPERFLRF